MNLNQVERGVLVTAGILLTLAGLRRTLTAAALSGLGVTLIVQGMRGYSPIAKMRALRRRQHTAQPPESAIDTALEDSFPASDPPAWPAGARH